VDGFVGMLALAVSAVFFLVAATLREENAKFKDARAVEGRITELIPDGESSGQTPVVMYQYLGERKVFKNSSTIQGAEVGQLVIVQVASDGSARVDSAGNHAAPILIMFLASAAFIFGFIMIAKGGF
jgi:hypothetical protein